MIKTKHPQGLFVLFFTEMWERFSYYGMRALLVLYMTQYLFIEIDKGKEVFGFQGLKSFIEMVYGPMTNQALSSQLYGLYTGFVYFTPFFGGIIADRLIGQRRSVYVGGFLMAIGHFLMAIESQFLLALFFLIIGNGFFKPNITTQVGYLYPEGDARRDSAFTIFYMGINLGAFFSPFICGTLGQKMGWHYGFGAAGIGMLVGLAVYHFGRHRLPVDRITRQKQTQKNEDQALTRQEIKGIMALVILCALNIVYWAIYEQQGNTMQLWAENNTNWTFFGVNLPSTWYQAFNPAMIFIFSPLLMIFWAWQNKKGKEPSSTVKMGMGCIISGLGFVVMVLAAKVIGPQEKGSLLWLTAASAFITLGEIYLSPIGLSYVTKVAPARMVSMLMGVWLMSSFFGNYASGVIGGYYNVLSKQQFFVLLTGLGIGTGLVFLAFARFSSVEKSLETDAEKVIATHTQPV